MKAWDPLWDEIFKNKEWGKYPTEELIRFIATNYYKTSCRNEIRILDLGCGYGSATWYLCREGFKVSALDGSPTAISLLRERLNREGLDADLSVADASELPYPDNYFDCVVDLVCLMCNDYNDTKKIIEEVYRVLKKGGRFFSYTPQVGCWGYGIGVPVGHNTYKNSSEGPFAHMGTVRFSSEEDILDLYSVFSPLSFDFLHRSVDNRKKIISFWILSGKKN
jgi:SAM-dependent methyltransferase